MRNWMKNAGRVALVGAGFFAVGSGIAGADTSDSQGSVLSGNQIEAPVSAPINVTGNALGVLGHATAQGPSQGQQSSFPAGERSGLMTSTRGSMLSGNQIKAPISVPVNVCGNAAALKGVAKGSCTEGTTEGTTVSAPTQACESVTQTGSAPTTTCNTTPTAPVPDTSAPTASAPDAPAPAAPVSACQPVAPATKAPCEDTKTSSVRTLPASPDSPASACQPVAPATKAPCEDSSTTSRILPATNPFSVTSMAVPSRKKHSAAQEVMTYEKLTNVRQIASTVADGTQNYVAVPTAK
jgi:hypothetical protein